MRLLTALTDDRRFIETIILANEEGKEINTMCKWLDEVEGRGIEKGIEKGKILEFINIRREDGFSDSQITSNLIKRFNLQPEEAEKALAEYVCEN